MRYYLVIDFETSDLLENGGQPVEIGAVLLDKSGLELLAEFQALVTFDPLAYNWSDEAERIHGISRDLLASNGKPASVVWGNFLEWLGTWVNLQEDGEVLLCGQNILFDLRFLQVLSGTSDRDGLLPPWACRTVRDTMQWAGFVNQATIDAVGFRAAPFKSPETGYPSVALENIAGGLGIQVVGSHSALEDARTTAKVMRSLLESLGEDLVSSRKWEAHLARVRTKVPTIKTEPLPPRPRLF